MRDERNFSRGGRFGAGLGVVGVLAAAPLLAQPPDSAKTGTVNPGRIDRSAQESPNQVVIDRQALKLIDPKTYQVPLQLGPIRSVDLAAPTAGVVRAVHLEPGATVDAQTEGVRIDSTEEQLLLEQAQARLDVAQIEIERAQREKDSELVERAEANLRAAKAGLELARYRLEQTRIRVPFAAKVFRVSVVAGQYVRAGEVLLHIGDTSQLKVEIPVDRNDVAPGQRVSIRVEETPVEVTVKHLLPLDARFEPLRDLIPSPASGLAVIENGTGQFHAGQTVYAPLMPRDPVAEVPLNSIANGPEGTRKIQVVRDHVVRDIRVRLLAQLGSERIYVSGPFADGDEVIVHSSRELPDGTQIRPLSTAAPGSASSRSAEVRSESARSESTSSKKPDF